MNFATDRERRLLFLNHSIFLRDKYCSVRLIVSEALRKYVGGFRLFHCSANKPSGWTKAACRADDEHVRVGFRLASTLSHEASHLEP